MMSHSYKIRIEGRVGPEMASLLAELDAEVSSAPTTVLTVEGGDQARLHGILARIRDLGLTIDTVVRSDTDSVG